MFDFIQFLRRRWSELSAASGQKGTVVDELAVKPTGLVMADFYNAMVDQKRINDIANWETMTEAELDAFGSKYFMPRTAGDYAAGTCRIYSDSKLKAELPENCTFVSEGGLTYAPVQPVIISPNSWRASDQRYALYMYDVPVKATAQGSSYNLDIGQITQLTGISFRYKMVTNPAAVTGGSKRETNAEYYARLRYAVNDRSMMNKKSAYALLPEFFPAINSMYVAGAGDKYMTRDLMEAVDISRPRRQSTFLGKIAGNMMVKNLAFYQAFPPEAGTDFASFWGPLSITSLYSYPLAIEATDSTSEDPGFHGYDLDQEFTNSMYQGLYFDDYITFSESSTSDLFNIADQDVGFTDVLVPNQDWMYGCHGRMRGDFGVLQNELQAKDVLSFNNNSMFISAGSDGSVCAGYDAKKRIGVKMTGTFVWPDSATSYNSNLQLMVGGVNTDFVEAYTGIGFGVRVTSEYPEDIKDGEDFLYNAVVYIAHSERYGTAQVFATDYDMVGGDPNDGHIGVDDIGALATKQFRIEPGIEYEFEFVVYDDLRVTLYFNKMSNISVDPDAAEVDTNLHFLLPSTVLNIYKQELTDKDSTHYGTMVKAVVDTDSTNNADDTWTVNNLKVFDVAQHRATQLFLLNVKDIEDPVQLRARAYGSGAVNGAAYEGYTFYIWDKENSSPGSGSSDLNAGAWTALAGISNPTGSRTNTVGLFTHDLDSLERYKVNSRYGNVIALMAVSSGTSLAQIRYSNQVLEDMQSMLRVDYLDCVSANSDYFHANNKADIWVSTVKNSEPLESVTTTISKNEGESFFTMNADNECIMPVAEIVSISDGEAVTPGQTISSTSYTVADDDPENAKSAMESLRIVLDQSSIDTITVEYRSYPEISRIQEFYDSGDYQKIYGDVIVKHKYPCSLAIAIMYTGATNPDDLANVIRSYVDDHISGTFSISDMIDTLRENGNVTSVQQPLSISYTRTLDDGSQESGAFSSSLTIRDIDFFRIETITAARL